MKIVVDHCPHCDARNDYDAEEIIMSPFTSVVCSSCGQRFRPKTRKSKGRSDAQRRSQGQEKKAAKRYGGHVQPGSGSSDRAKGDFRDPGVIRGECKETTNKSFSLKLEELMKIEKEATGTETPLFEIQFQGVHPFQTYVVLPAKEFQSMQDEIIQLRELVGTLVEEMSVPEDALANDQDN